MRAQPFHRIQAANRRTRIRRRTGACPASGKRGRRLERTDAGRGHAHGRTTLKFGGPACSAARDSGGVERKSWIRSSREIGKDQPAIERRPCGSGGKRGNRKKGIQAKESQQLTDFPSFLNKRR